MNNYPFKKLAIKKFAQIYGKNPSECGFNFIDIDKDNVFLYGRSEQDINYYKNPYYLLRWLQSKNFILPIVIPTLVLIVLPFFCSDMTTLFPFFIFYITFMFFWEFVVFIGLLLFYVRAKHKHNGNVISINY